MPKALATVLRLDAQAAFPLWMKLPALLLLCVLIPAYWSYYGPVNFLWFSNIGLLGAVLALWLENRLLASMMLLATFLPDGVAWNLDFLLGLIVGWHPLGGTNYMFDPHIPGFIRGLSLYHIVLPVLLVRMVYKLGYDRRALAAQTVLGCVVLVLIYGLTDPLLNINWAFGIGERPQTRVPGWLYLMAEMIVLPVLFYLPVDLLLRKLGWLPDKEA